MSDTKREALRIISEEEPIGHYRLAELTGLDWDEVQEIIRELRNDDEVRLTIDRRYTTET